MAPNPDAASKKIPGATASNVTASGSEAPAEVETTIEAGPEVTEAGATKFTKVSENEYTSAGDPLTSTRTPEALAAPLARLNPANPTNDPGAMCDEKDALFPAPEITGLPNGVI